MNPLEHLSVIPSAQWPRLRRRALPLGFRGPGGRDAFAELFQIAVTAAWARSATVSRSTTRSRFCAR